MIDRTHQQPHYWHKARRKPDHESPHPHIKNSIFRIYRFPNGYGVTATNMNGPTNIDWWTVGIVQFHDPDDIMGYGMPDKVIEFVSSAKLEVLLDQVEARKRETENG
jgi:hypothetical protein